jgi:hypothetical protein
MPDELALKLDQLNQLPIEFAGDVRLPGFVNSREFFRKVHLSRHTPVDEPAAKEVARSAGLGPLAFPLFV